MSTHPTSNATPKPEWKMSPTGSPAFRRLEEILEARYMGWVEFSMAARDSYSPRTVGESDIEIAIRDLEPQELARALVKACFHADVAIAKAIWEQRGPFEVDYQEGHRQVLINDEVVHEGTKANHILTNARSAKDIQDLMEWMPNVGLGFMCGVGTDKALLLQSYRIEQPIKQLSWTASFGGELPVLSYGTLAQPELMLVLDEKKRSSHYQDAFDHILCWVEEGMVREFADEFDAFESIQELYLKPSVTGGSDEIRAIPVSEVTEQALADVSRKSIVDGVIVKSDAPWSYHGLCFETFPVEPGVPENNLVLGYQADEPLKHGYNHKPGHVLCRTRVSFLRQFNIGPVQQGNLALAKEFAAGYFPLDLMLLRVPQVHKLGVGCVRLDNGMRQGTRDTPYLIRNLYKALGNDSPIQAHLQKSLTQPLLNYVRELYCEVTLDAESMLGLFQGLAIDNTGYRLDINYKDLQRLHDADFKFSDDSVVANSPTSLNSDPGMQHRLSSADTDVLININSGLDDAMLDQYGDKLAWNNRFANALRMNLWPAETPRPCSLLDALLKAGRKKKWGDSTQELALLAYIDHAGLEACAEVAKTATHWAFMKEHFGREAMTPYMRKIPAKVRGGILMDDMGL
jgi:hypothetical protein